MMLEILKYFKASLFKFKVILAEFLNLAISRKHARTINETVLVIAAPARGNPIWFNPIFRKFVDEAYSIAATKG